MSQIPDHLKYLSSHEWANLEPGGLVSVGITDHAQEQLGDVVFVELPDVGIKVSAGQEVAVVESVKAASDIYAPVSGTVVEVNDALGTAPELVNQSPYEQGWFFRIEPSDLTELDGLLDADGYADVVEGSWRLEVRYGSGDTPIYIHLRRVAGGIGGDFLGLVRLS